MPKQQLSAAFIADLSAYLSVRGLHNNIDKRLLDRAIESVTSCGSAYADAFAHYGPNPESLSLSQQVAVVYTWLIREQMAAPGVPTRPAVRYILVSTVGDSSFYLSPNIEAVDMANCLRFSISRQEAIVFQDWGYPGPTPHDHAKAICEMFSRRYPDSPHKNIAAVAVF